MIVVTCSTYLKNKIDIVLIFMSLERFMVLVTHIYNKRRDIIINQNYIIFIIVYPLKLCYK